jgi:hypothetical protein
VNIPLGIVSTVLLFAVASNGAGCSIGDDTQSEAAIQELQTGFSTRDMAKICERLTPSARKQAGSVAHGFPTRCKSDVRRAFGLIEEGDGFGPEPSVTRVRRDDKHAVATLTHKGGWRADVPLTQEDGTWKLAGFFGAAPSTLDAIEKSARTSPFPPADGQPIKALDASGRPCGEFSDERYPFISGGCMLTVSSRDVPFRMLTPFGDFKFGDCSVDYRLSIASDGRTWTQLWNVAGSSITGCSDIIDCRTPTRDWLPWKGRLSSDGKGGFLHQAQMCMRTCIGEFAGDFVTRLTHTDRGWRIEPTDKGATGFKIDAALRAASGKGLRIQPAPADGS